MGIPDADYPGMGEQLKKMLKLRQQVAYGDHDDYMVTPTKMGWVRRGTEDHPYPLAVLISTGDMDQERLFVGNQEAGQVYKDWSGKNEEVTIDDEGFGNFTVAPGSVTYWTRKDLDLEG